MLNKHADLLAKVRGINDTVREVLANSSGINSFMQRFLAYMDVGRDHVEAFITAHQERFLASLQEAKFSQRSRCIPLISHKVWLTDPVAPVFPPEEYLNAYWGMLTFHTAKWTNYFWTNSDQIADRVRSLARERNCPVLVQNTDDVFGKDATYARITSLVGARKFVLACDVLKFLLLERFGGLYSDLGIIYDDQVAGLVEIADYCLLLGNELFFQTSLLACAPRAPLANLFLALLNTPGAMAREYVQDGEHFTATDEVQLFAGPGFTAMVLLFMPPDARVMVFPPTCRHLVWQSQSSWYGSAAKHGNVLIRETQPTLIAPDTFTSARETRWGGALRFHGTNRFFYERFAILLGLSAYFAQHPTRLCEILYYHNSDKAFAWHNYSSLYNFLLDAHLARPMKVLEIGIGTNYLDTPSSMGESGSPGASLRAWREYFLNASIIGADIDRRILINEFRIKSHFVDQTDQETVQDLVRKEIAGQNVGVVIDDGLHAYGPNSQCFETIFPALEEGALYVVEDILGFELPQWHAFLDTTTYTAALVQLRHPSNKQDNSILFILKEPIQAPPAAVDQPSRNANGPAPQA